jgi:hypothetical protein
MSQTLIAVKLSHCLFIAIEDVPGHSIALKGNCGM